MIQNWATSRVVWGQIYMAGVTRILYKRDKKNSPPILIKEGDSKVLELGLGFVLHQR